MKYILSFFIILFFTPLAQAETDKANLCLMWSRTEGKINRVYDIEKDTVKINFSMAEKWTASRVDVYTLVDALDPQSLSGRLILFRDSAGLPQYKVIDYAALTLDSIRIYELPGVYADVETAKKQPPTPADKLNVHYTVEYLYYQKKMKNAPDLKKDEYLNFLKDAQAQAKKGATDKTLNMDPKIPIDKRVNEFLYAMLQQKAYKGKIFPHNLGKAQEKFKKDEVVQKQYALVRKEFIVKKTDPNAKTDDKDPKNQKKDSKSKPVVSKNKSGGADDSGKSKESNGVKISTDK